MRILALIGSPRKQGNTDILVNEICRASKTKGHAVEVIRLYDYEILPCIDCRHCKQIDADYTCSLMDGMQVIYPKMEDADLIIFGTPVYWYGPTAKMKLLIDRLRPFIASKRLKGKKGIVVIPSEEGVDCCGPMMEMFRRSFDYLGMNMVGSILARAYERGEIEKNPKEIRRAYELGLYIS